jgi:hypothetical protein
MASRTTLATLPGRAPHQRLQVALVQGRDGRISLELGEQDHAEGIGWFDQRTIQLDARQLRQLKGLLGPALDALEVDAEPPASIPFPGRFVDTSVRPAVGDGR